MYPNSIICIINSFWLCLFLNWASLVAQTVKNPPAMKETWDQSLGWEDPLEKGMETHSSILAWRIPWTEEPGWLQSMGSQGVGHDWTTDTDAPTVRDTYKLRKNQTPVALGLTAEHGSLSWKSVQNQLYLRSLRECFTWAPSPLLVLGCPSVATRWSLSCIRIDATPAMLT